MNTVVSAPAGDLLTVREVAERLRISINSVYSLVTTGKLACYRLGARRGSIRIRSADLEEYLQGCRKEASVPPPRAPRPRLKHLTL